MRIFPLRTLVPLWNFELRQKSSLTLEKHLVIRRLFKYERDHLEKTFLGVQALLFPRFVIVYSLPQHLPRHVQGKTLYPRYEYTTKVIEALRLFRTGDVGNNFFAHVFEKSLTTFAEWPSHFDSSNVGNSYILDRRGMKDFVPFWPRYKRWKPHDIQRHVDRFMGAYMRRNWLDRLVDLVTCMEGILLPDGGPELSYRFSLRLAWLLGSGRREREELFTQARDIYNLRSQVVHGRALRENTSRIEISRRAEGFSRRLILKAMENPSQFSVDTLRNIGFGAG